MHQDKEAQLIRDILLVSQKEMSKAGHMPSPPALDLLWEPVEHIAESESIKQFHFINNPTGTIRWFFPADSEYPAYLGLFNSAHWKARLYKLGSFAAFGMGLQKKLTSGSFWVKGMSNLPLEDILSATPHDTYGVFTGTVGENRKSIIALAKDKQITHFAKLAHSQTGEKLLQNEADVLGQLAQLERRVLQVPAVAKHASNILLLSNVKAKQARESAKIGELHLLGLEEWYHEMKETHVLGDLSWYDETLDRLVEIEQESIADPSLDAVQINEILNNLKRLAVDLSPDEEIPTALAHGDFTSWNMYVSDRFLHVYDWELAKPEMPLLYDLFHFVYQTGILLLKQSYSQIQREIKRTLRLPAAVSLVERFEIDVHRMHQLYLFYLVSYYLHIYVREPQVHLQVHWLLDTWNSALNDIFE